ncbi:MAG: hypothetical protein FWD55_04810 [Propionibacteriaceae bacterium]|nr:hypothetical protein [Propionibacteriaceae bacterium]
MSYRPKPSKALLIIGCVLAIIGVLLMAFGGVLVLLTQMNLPTENTADAGWGFAVGMLLVMPGFFLLFPGALLLILYRVQVMQWRNAQDDQDPTYDLR